MQLTESLKQDLERLNEEQRKAVDAIDGPLLVIAGPGTGKTQLLSLRAANILLNRDVQARNILCLTYTEAGAEAMRKRLIELIGTEAYGIQVCTFHGFAEAMRQEFPYYFKRDAAAKIVSDIRKNEIVDEALKNLSFGTPLSGVSRGVATNVRTVLSFISHMKRHGLEPNDYRVLMGQTIDAVNYLQSCEEFMSYIDTNVPRKAAEKERFIEDLVISGLEACAHAPAELSLHLARVTGIYEPFISYFKRRLETTPFIDEEGKTGALSNFKKLFFTGTNANGHTFSAREICEKGLIAASIYEHYQKTLDEQNLYDFDDMVMDFATALDESDEFRSLLQERYQYVQVDEFQDTNGAQMRIVDCLCEGLERPNVMAVGDDDQAIMRFQGASIECIEQFQDKYEPQYVVLKTNYRSTPQIVELGKEVARQIETRLPQSATEKDIQAFNGSSEQLEFCEEVYKTREEELAGLAVQLRARLDDEAFIASCKDSDEAIAVIAPKHASLRELIPYLREENVPFSYVENTELFAMNSMQSLFSLIKCACALSRGQVKVAEAYLPELLVSPEYGVGQVAAIKFASEARLNREGGWLDTLQKATDDALCAFRDCLYAWAAQASQAPVRSLLLEMSAPAARYYESQSAKNPFLYAEFQSGIRALLNFTQKELDNAHCLGKNLKLVDVQECLEKALLYGIKVDASISLDSPGAVRLITAHSSKGLEFDHVFLLDCDDRTWYSSARGTKIYPPNILFSDEKNDDDSRRLFFVAVTRAKRYLSLLRLDTLPVRDLNDLIELGKISKSEANTNIDGLACAIKTQWLDSFVFDTPELKALLEPNIERLSLSASALNTFVGYKAGCENTKTFAAQRILRLPEMPSIILEFGTTVHAFFEDYVNKVFRTNAVSAEDLIAKYKKQVEWLDFPEAEVKTYSARFDRIVQIFVPWMNEHLLADARTEVPVSAVVGNGVPLFGICDLLLVDNDTKEIHVVDYKTGFHYPDGEPKPDYARQLRFYRALIESSKSFVGYKVVSVENWYVEPEMDTNAVHPPVVGTASDEEVENLIQLIDAAWVRIKNKDFDTTAFEQSELFATAEDRIKGRATIAAKEKAYQAAYEEWLIESLD